jgi:hypothetical protein
MSKRQANRLIDAASVVSTLALGPIGPKPITESQCRELARLRDQADDIDHAKVAKVWERVVQQADGKVESINAKRIRQEVDAVLGAVKGEDDFVITDAVGAMMSFLRKERERWPERLRPRFFETARQCIDRHEVEVALETATAEGACPEAESPAA